MSHAPKLAYNDWQVIGTTTLLAWVDDTQFYDIRPGGKSENTDSVSLELRFNNVADGSVLYLGDCATVGTAIVRARKHLESK